MSHVDVLVHVHQQLPAAERSKVERSILDLVGVSSASFDGHASPHALKVVYDPDVIRSAQVLDAARRHDPAATLVGL